MITSQKILDGEMAGTQLTIDVLVEEILDTTGCMLCENYGLCVTSAKPDGETERKSIPGITTNGKEILSLFERVARMDVTPAILGDVVDDYLTGLTE